MLFCIFSSPFAPKLAGAQDFSAMQYMGQAKVEQIIDPQTIRLNDGRLIWLSGLDFPDNDPRDPGPLAVTTRDILSDYLDGETIRIYQTKTRDKGRQNRMGHEIAHITRKSDGGWVQGMLLSLGLARVRTTPDTPQLASTMYQREQDARGEKIGLWEEEKFQILTPDTAADKIGSFQIIEGHIQKAALVRNTLYLNFGANWRTDFTVMIEPADKRKFQKAGLDPLGWNGKTIRVRGWLEEYNGPLIRLKHPEAVEILNSASESATVP